MRNLPDPEIALAVASLDDRHACKERVLYRPTRSETINACETLLRADLPREARSVVREILETTETANV